MDFFAGSGLCEQTLPVLFRMDVARFIVRLAVSE
jgi:hypothetical protein